MKINCLIIFVICLTSMISYGQANSRVIGTRLTLDLPSEFKEDRNVPGYRSEIDSSLIFITEIKNPYTFEELVQKRISNSLNLGIDTSNFKESTYDGYKSVEFNTFNPSLNQFGFTINFGTDSFLLDISIVTSPNRLEEIKKLILNGKYNRHFKLDYESLLGFKVSYDGTKHKIFKNDANTINTREKDDTGNIVSWLNLTRMPKSTFEGLSVENSINSVYSMYSRSFSSKKYYSTDTSIIDGAKLLRKLYIEDHMTFKEYAFIGIIPQKEYDLLIMGGVDSKERLEQLYKVIMTIKFN